MLVVRDRFLAVLAGLAAAGVGAFIAITFGLLASLLTTGSQSERVVLPEWGTQWMLQAILLILTTIFLLAIAATSAAIAAIALGTLPMIALSTLVYSQLQLRNRRSPRAFAIVAVALYALIALVFPRMALIDVQSANVPHVVLLVATGVATAVAGALGFARVCRQLDASRGDIW